MNAPAEQQKQRLTKMVTAMAIIPSMSLVRPAGISPSMKMTHNTGRRPRLSWTNGITRSLGAPLLQKRYAPERKFQNKSKPPTANERARKMLVDAMSMNEEFSGTGTIMSSMVQSPDTPHLK